VHESQNDDPVQPIAEAGPESDVSPKVSKQKTSVEVEETVGAVDTQSNIVETLQKESAGPSKVVSPRETASVKKSGTMKKEKSPFEKSPTKLQSQKTNTGSKNKSPARTATQKSVKESVVSKKEDEKAANDTEAKKEESAPKTEEVVAKTEEEKENTADKE